MTNLRLSVVTIAIILLLVFFLMPATLGASPGDKNTIRPAIGRGDTIIPDRWLRTYDPVTVFFQSSRGPYEPSTELNPDRHVTLEPPHPGGWRWLNANVLQFEPAEPWPAYKTFTIQAGSASATLYTLTTGPVATDPAQNELDVPPVEAIRLTFRQQMPPETLAENIQIQLWNAPAPDGEPLQTLTQDDFSIKRIGPDTPTMEQADYCLVPERPIPEGIRARLILNLTQPATDNARFQLDFTTTRPFSVLSVGGGQTWQRIPPADEGDIVFSEVLEMTVNPPVLLIRMSAPPEPVTPAGIQDFIHIHPQVDDVSFVIEDRLIRVEGNFKPETRYLVTLRPTPLMADYRGRSLKIPSIQPDGIEMSGFIELPIMFIKPDSVLQWERNDVIVERFGPKMLPLQGRGHHVADIRLYKIDPLDRNLWPFPDITVATDPNQLPSGSAGADAFHDQSWYTDTWELKKTLNSMGAHHVSDIVELPLTPVGDTRSYGLDLASYMARIDGDNAPGTYLAGVQAIDSGGDRHWVRIQVTDLALTTVEEPDTVSFLVTSLQTAVPIANVQITLEGFVRGNWQTILSGRTNNMGVFRDRRISSDAYHQLRRIRVEHGNDILVLNVNQPPELFRHGYWQRQGDWLSDPVNFPMSDHRTDMVGHMFTDRPVYRPGDEVHIRGWIRQKTDGLFTVINGDAQITIDGPGGFTWNTSEPMNINGAFYHRFYQTDAPAGHYRATATHAYDTVATAHFQMEDYRIPQFEVLLHSVDTASLDKPFDVSLTARYYAGGTIADQPVNWRVTQHPLAWGPAAFSDFRFAVDDRFTSRPGLRETDILNTVDRTDDDGSALIVIDPLQEASLMPRNYVVEATVTGVDGQTVTSVRQIRALPGYLPGVSAPRVLEPGKPLVSRVVLVDAEGRAAANRDLTVRLIRRTWHTTLKAGNYGTGDLKYETHVVETPVTKLNVVSGTEPQHVSFRIDEAGVYIVEVSSRDDAGRTQRVSMDVFVQGDAPVAWERAPDRGFRLRTDKTVYETGDTAKLLIESPFQTAEAVAVIESPDGLEYIHSAVRNGAGVINLPVKGVWCPKIQISVLLMRGRIPGTHQAIVNGMDPGRPQTLAATTELNVSRNQYQAGIELQHPERAVPGETIDITILLTDSNNRPLQGEAALWLVDRAVLALGRESDPNPLSDLLKPFGSHIGIRDTREFVVGQLPGIYSTGGDFGEDMIGFPDWSSLRRKFVPVPFYKPFVAIGRDGRAQVSVQLPDNLTEFAVRARANSGTDRFGHAESRLAVRLPVVMQPTLPRFVRPGDVFDAIALSRIVEGESGPGRIMIETDGLTNHDSAVQRIVWQNNLPVRSEFRLECVHPGYDAQGNLSQDSVTVRLAAERSADGVSDAVEMELPIDEGVNDWTKTWQEQLNLNETAIVPGIDLSKIREDSAERIIRISTMPIMNLALQAESILRDYPYGCAEQQLSRASGFLAAKALRSTLNLPVDDDMYDMVIQTVIDYLPTIITPNGLVAFWPGDTGYVHLAARAFKFLGQARQAGFSVDPMIVEQISRALKSSLRSDNRLVVDGYLQDERAMALEALALFGQEDTGYIEEMARQAEHFGVETRARIIHLFASVRNADKDRLQTLLDSIWRDIVIETVSGKPIVTGLRQTDFWYGGFMTDVTALAEALKVMLRYMPDDSRNQALADGVASLMVSGWMTTYRSAAVLDVVREMLEYGLPSAPDTRLDIDGRQARLGGNMPLLVLDEEGIDDLTIRLVQGQTVYIQAGYRGKPVGKPAELPAESRGFAVQRRWMLPTPQNRPGERRELDEAGQQMQLESGAVMEEHIQLVNPEDRYYVVVNIPLAAGIEPLNPRLATAPPEAIPTGKTTRAPDYMEMRDQYVTYYYNVLPAGTYHFYFRTKASFSGRFSQPGAYARMMYDFHATASSPGVYVSIESKD
jgi:alpha-2-macroglobulin